MKKGTLFSVLLLFAVTLSAGLTSCTKSTEAPVDPFDITEKVVVAADDVTTEYPSEVLEVIDVNEIPAEVDGVRIPAEIPARLRVALAYTLETGEAYPEQFAENDPPALHRSGETVCDCTPDPFIYARKTTVNDVESWTYHSDVPTLLAVVNAFTTFSPLTYDLDGDGTVGTSDLTSVLSGYGTEETSTAACDFTVDVEASSAWITSYPDCDISFLHVTVLDESGMSSDACPLNTFWTERVYSAGDSTVVDFWRL